MYNFMTFHLFLLYFQVSFILFYRLFNMLYNAMIFLYYASQSPIFHIYIYLYFQIWMTNGTNCLFLLYHYSKFTYLSFRSKFVLPFFLFSFVASIYIVTHFDKPAFTSFRSSNLSHSIQKEYRFQFPAQQPIPPLSK